LNGEQFILLVLEEREVQDASAALAN